MADDGGEHTQAGDQLACPRCDRLLVLSLLNIAEDDGDEPEMIVLLDCPNGDFHSTLTQEALLELFTGEVLRRLRWL